MELSPQQIDSLWRWIPLDFPASRKVLFTQTYSESGGIHLYVYDPVNERNIIIARNGSVQDLSIEANKRFQEEF